MTPNCKSASGAHVWSRCRCVRVEDKKLASQRVRLCAGCDLSPICQTSILTNFWRWQERHINLSDHNLRDKAFKFGVGELRTKILDTCRLLGHFTSVWLCHCHMYSTHCSSVRSNYHMTSEPSTFLLAPTGALIVTLCYYISVAAAATFSDFHSDHWCKGCYKSHSKSLKQYQCNWCQKIS